MRFKVEQMRDGITLKRTEAQGSDLEAAQIWGPVTAPNGKEPIEGEWIRVTHLASGRTSWFRQEGTTPER
ncbi:hypothetical protein EOC06_08790 [Mesorhizobium sp. M7A.F.Ca.MR.362.00.0.0]|nr:hypothetical protein EOC06_08790 [Mesorhizobium sp. M7A.F.Ca.MR.362.00.0.0]